MPGAFQTSGLGGVPNTMALPPVRGFTENTPIFEHPYFISGVTRDANGNAIGNCIVILFRTADNSIAAITVSDASGNYVIVASQALQHYAVAYLAGSPDVFGTTVNTLVGA